MKNYLTKKIKYIILFIFIIISLYLIIFINLHEKKKTYIVPIYDNAENLPEKAEDEKNKKEMEENLKLLEDYNNQKLLVLTFDDGPRKLY